MAKNLLLDGLVRIFKNGIDAKLEIDERARRWVKNIERTMEFRMKEVGTISIRINKGQVSVKAGKFKKSDYVVEAEYETIVDYVNGELGYSELLLKVALGSIKVKKSPLLQPSELITLLRMDELLVLSHKKEGFPFNLLDDARKILLWIAG